MKKKAKNKAKKQIKRHVKKSAKAKTRNVKAVLRKGAKLSAKELIKYKAMLLDKKEDLLKDIQHISKDTLNKSQRDATGEVSGYTFHMADVATDNYDRDFGFGLATSEQKIIWDIDEALGRVNDKTFGFCLSCGGKINKDRLIAIPYTKYCKNCQQTEEHKKPE